MRTNKSQRLLAVLLVFPLLLSACVNIPSGGKPQVVSTYLKSDGEPGEMSPKENQASDLIVSDFIRANSYPSSEYKSARSFMTEDAADSWDETASVTIISKMGINADNSSGSNFNTLSYTLRGSILGTVRPGGVFVPVESPQDFEEKIELVKVRGQWRISELSDGVIMERSDFFSNYEARNTYFFDPSSKYLVPDRRWLYRHPAQVPETILNNLVSGPQDNLRAAVRQILPPEASARFERNGQIPTVTLTGIGALSPEDKELLGAQIVWSLTQADIHGPYEIFADGAALARSGEALWTVEQVGQYNPVPSSPTNLYALVDGNLLESTSDGAAPVKDDWGSSGQLESVGLAATDNLRAGVFRENDATALVVGTEEQGFSEVLQARTISRPTWSHDVSYFYVVVDGQRIVRVTRSSETGETVENEVQTLALNELENPSSEISAFRISPDGVRAALVIDGTLYVSVIQRDETAGEYSLGSPQPIAMDIASNVLSIDWQPDSSLVVGTSEPNSPLWRITLDGSRVEQLASRNVAAPVTDIESTTGMLYITDSHAMLQLSLSEGDSTNAFWREIPEFLGYRGSPVLSG